MVMDTYPTPFSPLTISPHPVAKKPNQELIDGLG